MKKILILLLAVFVFAGCNDKPVDLVTINVSAYADDKQAIGNFAILSPAQSGIYSDPGALNRYFATIQQNSKVGVTKFTTKVLPGEYVIAIQLKEGNPDAFFLAYTYNFITTRGSSASADYVMQFKSGKTTLYQPWVDKK